MRAFCLNYSYINPLIYKDNSAILCLTIMHKEGTEYE